MEWNKLAIDNKPDTQKNVLVSFEAHYGTAVNIGWLEDDGTWFLSSDQDGTLEEMEEDIEIKMWAELEMPPEE